MNFFFRYVRFLALIPMCGLFGCEGNTEFVFRIANESSNILDVAGESHFGDTIRYSIPAHVTETLFTRNQLGGNRNPVDPSTYFKSLVIVNDMSDTATLDFRVESNWEAEIGQLRKIPSHYRQEYTLPLTDNDF